MIMSVAIRLMSGHMKHTVIADMASVTNMGGCFAGSIMRNASFLASGPTMKNSSANAMRHSYHSSEKAATNTILFSPPNSSEML